MAESLYYLFIGGLILGSGPCLGFCAPILVSFIAVYRPSFKKAVFSYLTFSLFKTFGYITVGLALFIMTRALKNGFPHLNFNIVNMGMGIFILSIGIVTVFSSSAVSRNYCSFFSKGNFRNAGILGILAGLSPCFVFLGVMNYIIIISRSAPEVFLYTFVFGLGAFFSPVILLIGLSGKVAGVLSENKNVAFLIRVISGLILIFFGARVIYRAFIA